MHLAVIVLKHTGNSALGDVFGVLEYAAVAVGFYRLINGRPRRNPDEGNSPSVS
jgi:hypothetical protein